MHRRPWKAERNEGFSPTVSARALLSSGDFLGSLVQDGIRPHRIGISSRPTACCRTTQISVVGGTLYRGSNKRSRLSATSASNCCMSTVKGVRWVSRPHMGCFCGGLANGGKRQRKYRLYRWRHACRRRFCLVEYPAWTNAVRGVNYTLFIRCRRPPRLSGP
jgi:hypothetical protein